MKRHTHLFINKMRQHYTNKKYLPSVVSFSMFVCLLKNLLLKRAMYYNVTMFVCLTSVTPIILSVYVCVYEFSLAGGGLHMCITKGRNENMRIRLIKIASGDSF